MAVLAVFAGLLVCTWGIFQIVPGGFIPAQDKQYLIGIVQLPDAASLDRTEKVVRQISQEEKEYLLGVATPSGFQTFDTGVRQFEQRGGFVLSARFL
jgi:multidrug efflux pump subunit AcrB